MKIQPLETLEDIEDIEAITAAQNDAFHERFPLELIERIATGENAIKVFREYRNLSQVELAKKAKVSRQYIFQLEAGERTGITKILKTIAKILAVDLEDIV